MGMGLQEIRNERRGGLSFSEQITLFLEDQHPLVRANLKLGVVLWGIVVVLHIGLWVALRVLDFRAVFSLELFLHLFQTLLVLMLIMMTYNALRVLYNFLRGHGVFTGVAVTLSFLTVLMVVLSFVMLPNIFKRSVAHSTGRSYNSVYEDFREICERWENEWGDSESLNTLKPEEENLGRIADEVELYKLQSTVIFNFGDGDQEFGFACALRDREPSEVGRASNYDYDLIRGVQYRFIEKKVRQA